MHAEVTVVLVEGPERGDVRRSFHDLVHPLYGPHHFVSLFLREDRRTLVLCNLTLETRHKSGDSGSSEGWRVEAAKGLTVCVYSHDEVISHGLGLPQLVGVAVMDHVIATNKNKRKKNQNFFILAACLCHP